MYVALNVLQIKLNHVMFVALMICKGWKDRSPMAASSDGAAIISIGLTVVSKCVNYLRLCS
jgi:hypothetical protein